MQARLCRRRWRVLAPVAGETLAACVFQRHQTLGVTTVLVAFADVGVVGVVGGDEGGAQVAGNQRLGDTHRARGVLHPHRRCVVVRVDLQRGVRARCGRAANHQRHDEALPLHFLGDVAHFFQRRRDQAGKADDVGVLGTGRVQNLLRRHHHTQVDHLEVVAGQDHADDVLADVVHIALDRGHDDPAIAAGGVAAASLLGFDVGQQVGHRLLHHPCRLHHLRQEHLAGTEQIADHVHAIHQRAFDHVERSAGTLPGFFGIGFHPSIQTVHQCMRQACVHWFLAPGQVFGLCRALAALVAFGDFKQALGGITAAVEDHVLHPLAQVRLQFVVDRHGAGVDDTHVHARGDRVVQEHRVDRLAHGLVATERERYVRYAAGYMAVRQRLLDDAGGFDEVDRVVVMLFNAGGDGEDVRVEDDVLRREADVIDQQAIGAGADFDLARAGVGLPGLIESHHHRGGAIAQYFARMLAEQLLAFLQRDRIDHALALQALQTGFDHAPLGGVDHHRNAGDVRLGHDQVEEAGHRLLGIDQALVHVDVEDLCATGHLLAGHVHGFFVAFFLDQLAELRAAGDVGALADVDEQQVRRDDQRFQTRQAGVADFSIRFVAHHQTLNT
ncbi:hypothetical protein D3C71_797220 [compost metagenome]